MQAELSQEQKSFNIKRAPSLLELVGYAYFIGGCFAAPIFSLRPYLEFVAGKMTDNDRGLPPDCVQPALGRFGAGCVYLVLYTSLSPVFTNAYLMSQEFAVGGHRVQHWMRYKKEQYIHFTKKPFLSLFHQIHLVHCDA